MSEQNTPPKRPTDPNKRTQPPSGGNWLSRSWFWIVLVLLLVIGSRFLFSSSGDTANLVGLNQIAQSVNNDDVRLVTVQGETIYVQLKSDPQRLQSRKENSESLLETLRALGVSEERLQALPIEVESAPNSGAIFSWLVMLLASLAIAS